MPGPQPVCVYQLKVVLRGISPMIWRRLLLRSDQRASPISITPFRSASAGEGTAVGYPAGVYPVCTGGQRLAPPEDCGGARVYMEEGDPRWREWWDAMPRQELALMAETVERVLDSGGDRSVIGDRESLLAALERVKAHRDGRPDRLDRRSINQRLWKYARGDREWLFCDTIGG